MNKQTLDGENGAGVEVLLKDMRLVYDQKQCLSTFSYLHSRLTLDLRSIARVIGKFIPAIHCKTLFLFETLMLSNGERRRIWFEFAPPSQPSQQTIWDYPSEAAFKNVNRAFTANKRIVSFVATYTLVTTSRRDNNHEQNGSVLSVISQNTNFCCHKISCQCLLCVPFSYTFDVFNCFA